MEKIEIFRKWNLYNIKISLNKFEENYLLKNGINESKVKDSNKLSNKVDTKAKNKTYK